MNDTENAKPAKCLNPACDKSSMTRGLCKDCYQVANRMVRTKKTTWAALEASGKCHHSNQYGATSAWLLDTKAP